VKTATSKMHALFYSSESEQNEVAPWTTEYRSAKKREELK